MTKERFRMFVDVFDSDKLIPGRIIRFLEDDAYVDAVVTEVKKNTVKAVLDTEEIELPISEIDYIGGKEIQFRTYSTDIVPCPEPLVEGRIPTKWLMDNWYKLTPEEQNDLALTEDVLKEIVAKREGTKEEGMGSNRREDFAPKEPAQETVKKKQITADLVIAKYLETRDIIEAKTKALQEELAELKALQGRREQWLTAEMDRLGTDTLKKKDIGTSFFEKTSSATVADGAAFMTWVGEDFETRKTYLENRVSKTAVKQGLEDNIPPPPGINYTTVRVLRVRRA